MTGESLLTLIVIICMAYAIISVLHDRAERRRRQRDMENRWFK